MMGWTPRCYIPSLVEIGPPLPEKIFKGFYHIWAWPPSWSCDQHHVIRLIIFISLYLKAFIRNLVQIGTVVFVKIRFEFLYVHDLGARSRNDLDLQYSHTFIYSIRCLLLLTFRSLADGRNLYFINLKMNIVVVVVICMHIMHQVISNQDPLPSRIH